MAPLSPADALAAVERDANVLAASESARRIVAGSAGGDERALWGRVRGTEVYETAVDLEGPAFRCSCPSRRSPCKHAVALLLNAVGGGGLAGARPEWVDGWLGERDEKARRKAERGDAVADVEAQRRRMEEREARVLAGLEELDRWLGDLVRRGFASLQGEGYGFYDAQAARLVDAQAPGLARRVRQLAGVALSGEPDWPERLLERVGLLHLLVAAYRRQAELGEEERADVRAQVGWTVAQDELLAAAGVRDRWRVLGWRIEEDERYRTQRVWLRGEQSRRGALVLTFSAAAAPLDRTLVPGTVADAELVFFPGAVPMRALVKQRHGVVAEVTDIGGFESLDAASAAWADALARSPWIEEFPWDLRAVIPVAGGVTDGERFVPFAPRFEGGWRLLALSGARRIGVFGEWNGRELLPLAATAEGRHARL